MSQVKDPVCGMIIDPDRAAAREHHGDHDHFFCSSDCARAFRLDPARYSASEEMRERTPPHMMEGGLVTPMFGSAGSGGAEFEPVPQEDEGALEED